MARRSIARRPGVDTVLRPPQPAELSNEMPLLLSKPSWNQLTHPAPRSEARGQWARKDTPPCPARDQTWRQELLPSLPERGHLTLGTGIPASANSFHGWQRRAEALRAIHVHSLHRPGLLPGWSAAPSWPPPVPRGPAVNVTSLSCDLGLPACRWTRATRAAEPGTDQPADPGVPGHGGSQNSLVFPLQLARSGRGPPQPLPSTPARLSFDPRTAKSFGSRTSPAC